MDRDRLKKLLALASLSHKPFKERRQHRRYLLRLPLLEINGTSKEHSYLADCSVSGARLELPFSPPLLSPLNFKVQLPEGNQTLEFSGRVIWTKPAPLRGQFFVGVQFYQFHWELERLLEKICA